jgi:hypothetical protein
LLMMIHYIEHVFRYPIIANTLNDLFRENVYDVSNK